MQATTIPALLVRLLPILGRVVEVERLRVPPPAPTKSDPKAPVVWLSEAAALLLSSLGQGRSLHRPQA